MATHFEGPIICSGGFQGDVVGGVSGNITGNVSGLLFSPAPTAYAGATGSKAISPSIAIASLTKADAGTDYTLAAPGASNVGKILTVYTATAAAHVVTVTGLLGGTTMTFTAAIGNSFTIIAISATAWAVIAVNGVTQS